MYKLAYTAEAKRRIDKLNPAIQRQLKQAIERVAENPQIGKRLSGELSQFYSYRSGDYRVIYKVFHHEVLVVIVTVGHRRDVYKRIQGS